MYRRLTIFSGLFSLTFVSVFMMTSATLAQTAAPAAAAPAAGPSMFESLVPFAAIFLIFWFLIIRPQSQRQKEQANFVSNLKRGDEVLTASGILGKIDGLTEQFVTLEVDQGVKLRILRSQIAGSAKPSEPAKATK